MLHKPTIAWMQENARKAALPTTLLFFAISFLVAASPAAAERASRPPVPADKKVFSAEESKALGEAAQRRDEARQQVWDRKMKTISKGICVGC
jgi:hypothetical protein